MVLCISGAVVAVLLYIRGWRTLWLISDYVGHDQRSVSRCVPSIVLLTNSSWRAGQLTLQTTVWPARQ